MLNANYIRHLKPLGKLCYLYDIAGTGLAALKTLRATTYDQVADGTDASAPGVDVFAQYRSRYNNVISQGQQAQQDLALAIATSYMVSDDFIDDLTTQPTSRTIANVIAALETEMAVGVDNKTLTTEAATGLVNFFDTLKGSEGTWNTSGSPDYPDSVYVVSAVV